MRDNAPSLSLELAAGAAPTMGGGFGPELVANGSSSAGWTATNTTLSDVGGYLRVTRANTTAFATANRTIGSLTVGATYRVTGEFLNPTGANIYVGFNANQQSTATSGTFSFDMVAGSTVYSFAAGFWNTAGNVADFADFRLLSARQVL